MSSVNPQPPPTPAPAGTPEEPAAQWQRLDARMLLLRPIEALKEIALPFVIAVVGLTATSDQPPLKFVALGGLGMVLIGTVPWLTTRYLVSEDQLRVRTGLINKKRLTTNLDRVRTVDVTASVLHRVLGLAKVEVGTGVDTQRIELNALSTAQAEALARTLQARSAAARSRTDAAAEDPGPTGTDGSQTPRPAVVPSEAEESPADPLATIEWSWLRFAPLSLSRLVVIAGAFGLLTQFVTLTKLIESLRGGYDWLAALGAFVAGLVVVVSLLVGWLIVSMGGYVVAWAGYALTAGPRTLHFSAGLMSTRSITIELGKLRGVMLDEPLLLRLGRGARLTALATGVGVGGTTSLLPPAPLRVCRTVGAQVLERGLADSEHAPLPSVRDQDADPLTVALIPHGGAARRRCHVRSQLAHLAWVAVVAVAGGWFGIGWWELLAIAAVLVWAVVVGELAYRNLGHALTRDHVVIGSGLLTRRRTVVERAGALGWVIDQSLFQRRAGLVTLTLPFAAGSERAVLRDVPVATALRLADRATPGLLGAFASAT